MEGAAQTCSCEKVEVMIHDVAITLHCISFRGKRYLRKSDAEALIQMAQEGLKLPREKNQEEARKDRKLTACSKENTPFLGHDTWLLYLKRIRYMRDDTYLLLAKLVIFELPIPERREIHSRDIESPSRGQSAPKRRKTDTRNSLILFLQSCSLTKIYVLLLLFNASESSARSLKENYRSTVFFDNPRPLICARMRGAG